MREPTEVPSLIMLATQLRRSLHSPPKSEIISALVSFPSFHSIFTPTPPLGAQSGEFTSVPVGRACREQPDRFLVALQQHFCDTCGGSEVSVDLERRVRIEHIRVGRMCEELFEILVNHASVIETRPHIGDPRAAPACVTASVDKSPYEGSPCRVCELGSLGRSD